MIQYKFPLGYDIHDSEDLLKMIEVIINGKITMGSQVETFEKSFAQYLGVKYAVMVNSGSSANLLALSTITNHKYSKKLNPGDEVLIPAVCWSTSCFPITQNTLRPVFVDVDSKTLNIDLDDLERKITPKTKALMAVHVLGNCCDMGRLMEIINRNNLILIEDTCESLGSAYDRKYLGTFGAIGTYSFYYSHHLCTFEGGAVVTNSEEIYEILKALRAHGWSRNLKNKEEIAQQNPDIDSRFTFINLGYNVRPMELQGAMGSSQLKKLAQKNLNRKLNYNQIKRKIEQDKRNTFLSFPTETENADSVWFGIVLFLDSVDLKSYINYLTENSVETRPIISGNMVRQPVIKDLYPELKPENFPGAEVIHHTGLFIGLSCELMSDEKIDELVNILLGYNCNE